MKRRLLLIYLGLLVFLISGLGLVYFLNRIPSPNVVRDYSDIAEERILRIGIIQDTLYDEIGTMLNDKSYKFFRNFESTDSIETEIHLFLNKQEALAQLSVNNIDVVASNIPITTEYLQQYNFTNPIDTDRLVLIQRKNNIPLIKNVLELENKTIEIANNPSIVSRMKNLYEETGIHIIINTNDTLSTLNLIENVANGLIDFTIADEKIAKEIVKKRRNLDISLPIGFSQNRSWVLRKESVELLDSMNVWIERY